MCHLITNDVIQKVNDIKNSNPSVEIYLIERDPRTKVYTIHHPAIHKDIGDSISIDLLNTATNILDEKNLVEFDPLVYEDSTIEFVPSDDVECFNEINQKISNNDINPVGNFQDINVSDLWCYCIKIVNNTTQEYSLAFKKYSHPKVLKKGYVTRFMDNILSRMTDEIFLIDNKIDVFYFQNHLYIFNRYFFELIFNYRDNYFTILNKALETLDNKNVLSNFDAFKEVCVNSNRIAKKFTKIMKDNSLDTFFSNINSIQNVINNYQLDIEFNANDEQLIYNDPTDINEILKLLSDDFVQTALGEIKCEAISKRPLN